MSDQRGARKGNLAVLLVPRRALVLIAAEVAVAVLVVVLIESGALARATTATTIADRAELAVQQAAAERDLERGYEQNVEQVRKVRALKLPLPAPQVDAITTKALADLKTLRHSAFVSLGQALGAAAGDTERYAVSLEQRYDAQPASAEPARAPVLLAPRLYAIVVRMDDLAGQLSDRATRDLTQPPAPASATPSAAPAASPTLSPRPSASPTPSR